MRKNQQSLGPRSHNGQSLRSSVENEETLTVSEQVVRLLVVGLAVAYSYILLN